MFFTAGAVLVLLEELVVLVLVLEDVMLLKRVVLDARLLVIEDVTDDDVDVVFEELSAK